MNIKEVQQATRKFQVINHQEDKLVGFAVIDAVTGDRICLLPIRERAQEYADHMNACLFLNKIKEPTKAMLEAVDCISTEREIFMSLLSSLVAAVSLLERGGKKAAFSDNGFKLMMNDCRNSINAGRAALMKGTSKFHGSKYIWRDMIEALIQEMIREY